MVTEQLRQLAGSLADLQCRVRRAVAGEVGRAVAEAIGEVLVAVLGGHLATMPRRVGRTTDYDPHAATRDEWGDPDSAGWDPSFEHLNRPAHSAPADFPETNASIDDPIGPAALAVSVAAGRWWLARRGSPWGAAGAGLAAGATLLAGGPMARTALAVLMAVQRLLAATDALKEGAEALDRA
jgi:hypothetical protein